MISLFFVLSLVSAVQAHETLQPSMASFPTFAFPEEGDENVGPSAEAVRSYRHGGAAPASSDFFRRYHNEEAAALPSEGMEIRFESGEQVQDKRELAGVLHTSTNISSVNITATISTTTATTTSTVYSTSSVVSTTTTPISMRTATTTITKSTASMDTARTFTATTITAATTASILYTTTSNTATTMTVTAESTGGQCVGNDVRCSGSDQETCNLLQQQGSFCRWEPLTLSTSSLWGNLSSTITTTGAASGTSSGAQALADMPNYEDSSIPQQYASTSILSVIIIAMGLCEEWFINSR